MKKILIHWIGVFSLLAFSTAAFAVAKEVPVDALVPDNIQRQTALIVNRVLERYHYRKVVLDNKLSEKILDRYLESLDPNKSCLLYTSDAADE